MCYPSRYLRPIPLYWIPCPPWFAVQHYICFLIPETTINLTIYFYDEILIIFKFICKFISKPVGVISIVLELSSGIPKYRHNLLYFFGFLFSKLCVFLAIFHGNFLMRDSILRWLPLYTDTQVSLFTIGGKPIYII